MGPYHRMVRTGFISNDVTYWLLASYPMPLSFWRQQPATLSACPWGVRSPQRVETTPARHLVRVPLTFQCHAIPFLPTTTHTHTTITVHPPSTILHPPSTRTWPCRFNEKHGVEVPVTTGLFIDELPDADLARIRDYTESMHPWAFAGFEFAVTTAKSFIVADALTCGKITPAQASEVGPC